MFTGSKAFSSFSVNNLQRANEFYGNTLGLRVVQEGVLLTLKLGSSQDVLVYEKSDHAPGSFTVLNFKVDNVEAAVGRLVDSGLTMERYDGFSQDDKGVLRGNGPSIAWFKDPAGNILSVLENQSAGNPDSARSEGAHSLTSVMVSSTDPERLHGWYTRALPPATDSREGGYRILGYGGFYLFIDTRSDVVEHAQEPGRVILNFEVDDARAVAARVDTFGTAWLAQLEDRDGSLFGTMLDPDGNYVQIIQLSEEAKKAMSVPS